MPSRGSLALYCMLSEWRCRAQESPEDGVDVANVAGGGWGRCHGWGGGACGDGR